jgi:hypothetical protein
LDGQKWEDVSFQDEPSSLSRQASWVKAEDVHVFRGAKSNLGLDVTTV